jgi:hypothetical protein
MRAAENFTKRLGAWFVTGPLGHFVSGLIDWVLAVSQALLGRLRRRGRGSAL